MKQWLVYILKCSDGTLYTGCTNDIEKRLKVHTSGKGAKYTKVRLPVVLVYSEGAPDRSAALKRELEIKALKRKSKVLLTQGYSDVSK